MFCACIPVGRRRDGDESPNDYLAKQASMTTARVLARYTSSWETAEPSNHAERRDTERERDNPLEELCRARRHAEHAVSRTNGNRYERREPEERAEHDRRE